MLMLMTGLLIWGGPAMAEVALPAKAVSDVEAALKTAPCKGLKPYNNVDELLYQFYINLDSDCLFEMPVDELEKVWDTKILYQKEGMSPEEYKELRNGPDFRNKPYSSSKDAFYVEVSKEYKGKNSTTEFYINMTACYAALYNGSLFSPNEPPQLLPLPLEASDRGPGLSWPSNINTRKIYCLFSSEMDDSMNFFIKHWGADNWQEWPTFKSKERIISCSFF
ncbi:hypothetical protein LJB99_05185 [Deltaproteobacteria bacterium OttesenSCG-928-K17]|nr:hypothetical protein [Deltaproteobacteria bacterium OttesenSCG-928-K17]